MVFQPMSTWLLWSSVTASSRKLKVAPGRAASRRLDDVVDDLRRVVRIPLRADDDVPLYSVSGDHGASAWSDVDTGVVVAGVR
jgi:hypothetical protein